MLVLQFLLTAAACFALWALWRAIARRDATAGVIVGVGLVGRAFAAQALFWISWLGLPVARSLQIGNGFWFFAIDAPDYFRLASSMADQGLVAIVTGGTFFPSRAFVQLLALFVTFFGAVSSVAILLNCAAFVATCAIVVRIGAGSGRTRLVALAAIAFGPSTILWSLQALKDTFFIFLIVAAVGICFLWQERPTIVRAVALFAVLYGMAGIRWYFAVIVWGAWGMFALLTAWQAPRRAAALLVSALLFVLLAQAVRIGGGRDVPEALARLLDPRTVTSGRPAQVAGFVADARSGFEKTQGATKIEAGRALMALHPRPDHSAAQARATMVAATLVSGAAATFLPRSIAQAVGLIRVGGGRGLWFFTELDSIVFDAVVLFALGYCAAMLRRSRSSATPLFVMLLIVFVATAVPLMYTVSNYGTLFRLRQMLYIVAAVLPLTVRSGIEAVVDADAGETEAGQGEDHRE